jgi:voltage-gated potassium channel
MNRFGSGERKQRATKEVPEWRGVAFDRFQTASELPLLLLSVVMLPVIIVPLVKPLSGGMSSTFDTLDYLIWAIFVIEYVVLVTLAPRRWNYVTHHVPDLVVCGVPMLRPLRIVRSARALRLARLTRMSAFAGGGVTKAKKSTHAEGVKYVVIITSALILVTSIVVYDLERDVPNSTIHSWPDALWWAISTVTTVGYGDKVPVTAGGRAIAVVLMLCGIALVGVITAALATYFVKQSQKHAVDADAGAREEVSAKLDLLLAEVADLRTTLAEVQAANQ